MTQSEKEYSSKYSSNSKRRKTVGVTIKPELLAKAREIDVNLSKSLENALEQLIKAQSNRFSLSEGSLAPKGEFLVVGRTGFEPATFCTSSRCPNQLDDRPFHFSFRIVFSYLSFSLSPA